MICSRAAQKSVRKKQKDQVPGVVGKEIREAEAQIRRSLCTMRKVHNEKPFKGLS